jgi:hypothetical protein
LSDAKAEVRGRPNDFQAHWNLAVIYVHLNLLDEAEAVVKLMKKLAPENARDDVERLTITIKTRRASANSS